MASSFSQQSILFHRFHLGLVELFSVVLCRLSRMDGIIWKLTEKPLFEVSPRGQPLQVKGSKVTFQQIIFVVQTLLNYTFRVFCSYFNMFTAQFIYTTADSASRKLLAATGLPSFLQVVDCHMLTVLWGENLKRRSVSIAA